MSRVGFDQTLCYLKGGFDTWKISGKEYDLISCVSAGELEKLAKEEIMLVFDVRKENEFISKHIASAQNTPLDLLNDYLDRFPENQPFYIHCAGGYRSIIANSILKSKGYHNLIDVLGGFSSIRNTDIHIKENICTN